MVGTENLAFSLCPLTRLSHCAVALLVTWEQLQNGKGSLVFDRYWPRLEWWVNRWLSGRVRSVLLARRTVEIMATGYKTWHSSSIVRSHHLEFRSAH